jgi:nucleotide-binding universal stress UspA family protein
MADITSVLVPVDFTEAAGEAARYAAALAVRFDAKLTLLHVAPPIEFEFSMIQPTPRRSMELAEHRARTLRQAFENFPSGGPLPVAARRDVAEGEPAEEIVRRAHQDGHDLIVMPTRGSSPVRRWLMIGSVTSKVLHGAECSVIAGRDFAHRYDPLKLDRIVCAVDLGPQCARVLCWSAGLAKRLEARLTIVHAAPGAGEAEEDFFDASWRSTLKGRLHEKISQAAEQAGAEGDIIIETGDPHKVVARVANRSGADLVVIGRGVAGDLVGRLRAHAYEIIRQSPCPVVSV